MKNWLLFAVAFIVRLFFYIFSFNAEKWRIHMLGRFDERALSLLAPDVVIKNLAAWGSYPSLLSFFYKILQALGLLEYRTQILFWLYQLVGLWLAYRILLFSKEYLKADSYSLKFIYLSISILILFNPAVIYLHSMNVSETGYLLVLWIAFERFISFWRHQRYQDIVIVFGLVGLSVVFRNMGILLVVAAFMYSIYLLWLKRISWFKSLILLAALFVSGLGFSYFNFIHDPHNGFSLNLNKGANVAQTWCEAPTIDFTNETNSFWFRPPSLWQAPNTSSLFLETEFQESGKYTSYAFKCLQDDPRVLISRFRSLLNLFDGPFYPDPLSISSSLGLRSSILLFLFVFAWLVTNVFTKGNHFKDPVVRLLWFIIISQFATVFIGNLGEARFLFSFYPFLVLLFLLYSKNLFTRDHQSFASAPFFWGSLVLALSIVGVSRLVPSTAELAQWRMQSSLDKALQVDAYGLIEQRKNMAKSHMDMFRFQSQCRSRLPLNVDCDRGEQKICKDKSALNSELVDLAKEEISADLALCFKYFSMKQEPAARNALLIQSGRIVATSSTSIALVANNAIDLSFSAKRGAGKISPELQKDLKDLLLFQFYRVENRTEFRGAVAENKQDRQASALAATQFYIALDLISHNLNTPVVQDGK